MVLSTTPKVKVIGLILILRIAFEKGFGSYESKNQCTVESLPNEIRIFRQLLSETPDTDRIARLGMINAKLAGLQGAFQIAIIVVMVNIRF